MSENEDLAKTARIMIRQLKKVTVQPSEEMLNIANQNIFFDVDFNVIQDHSELLMAAIINNNNDLINQLLLIVFPIINSLDQQLQSNKDLPYIPIDKSCTRKWMSCIILAIYMDNRVLYTHLRNLYNALSTKTINRFWIVIGTDGNFEKVQWYISDLGLPNYTCLAIGFVQHDHTNALKKLVYDGHLKLSMALSVINGKESFCSCVEEMISFHATNRGFYSSFLTIDCNLLEKTCRLKDVEQLISIINEEKYSLRKVVHTLIRFNDILTLWDVLIKLEIAYETEYGTEVILPKLKVVLAYAIEHNAFSVLRFFLNFTNAHFPFTLLVHLALKKEKWLSLRMVINRVKFFIKFGGHLEKESMLHALQIGMFTTYSEKLSYIVAYVEPCDEDPL